MTLDDKDVIQADAPVIAGVLILLTITAFTSIGTQLARALVFTITGSIVIPFSASAILIIWSNREEQTSVYPLDWLLNLKPYKLKASLFFMLIGFGYLIIAMVLLTVFAFVGTHIHS